MYNINDEINSLILKSWFIDLNFQKNKIIEWVEFFYKKLIFWSLFQTFFEENNFIDNNWLNNHILYDKFINLYQEIVKNIGLNNNIDIQEINFLWYIEKQQGKNEIWNYISLPKNKNNWDYFIINFDVGLWKTVTSVIIAKIICDTLPIVAEYINTYIKSIKLDPILDELNNNIDELLVIKEKWEIKINIITKWYISKEFDIILKKLNITNYEIFKSWRIIKTKNKEVDFDNNDIFYKLYTFVSSKVNIYMLNEYTNKKDLLDFDKFSWDLYLLKYFDSFFSTNNNNMSLWILDEFWKSSYNSMFFGMWKSNEVLSNNKYLFAICLTADVVTTKMFNNLSIDWVIYNSWFIKKQDIIDELVEKKLYKKDAFIYKNILMSSNALDKYDKAVKKFNHDINIISSIWKEYWKNIIELSKLINTIIEDYEKNNDLEVFIDNIQKINNVYKTELSQLDFKEVTLKMKEISTNLTNIKLDSFYKTKIQDLFNSNSLDYTFDKNTIIILDHHWTNEQVKEMKDYLKSNDLNIVSLEKYTEMTWTWNVMIWFKNDLIRWLNLQHFDNIVFLYFNQFAFDDVHQWIWRTDRLWTVSDKEIILLSFMNNEELIDKIIQKRKDISEQINIENILLYKDIIIPDNELLELNNSLDYTDRMLKKLDFDNKSLYIDKDLVTVYKNNNKLFKELLSNIKQQYKWYINFVSTFQKQATNEIDSKILWSIIDIFQ